MRRFGLILMGILLFAPASLAATSRFDVQGMVCESCAGDIKASLAKLEGIQSVTVDLEHAQVTITYDGKKVTPKTIIKAIDGYGFEAKLVERPTSPRKPPRRPQ
ncbi:Copper chaperone CopZ [compost metagenome]